MNEDLSVDLMVLLEPDGFAVLLEHYAGTRLYVPSILKNSKLPDAIGTDSAERLAKRYGPAYINVPLAREFRALRLRAGGYSNREIAVHLGVTERGVERIFSRVKIERPERMVAKAKKKDPRQIEMFDQH